MYGTSIPKCTDSAFVALFEILPKHFFFYPLWKKNDIAFKKNVVIKLSQLDKAYNAFVKYNLWPYFK